MSQDTSVLTLRIDSNLKKAFDQLCKDIDQTPSQMVRAFIRNAVQEHAKATAQPTLPTIEPAPQQTNSPKAPKKGNKLAAASMARARGNQ